MAFVAALGLGGCVTESRDHHHGEDPWAHVCEHAGDVPVAVTATVDAMAAPPVVGAAHTLYAVSFAPGARVRVEFGAHGRYGFFLTADVPVALTTAAGDTVALGAAQAAPSGCAELAVLRVAHADSGTYDLTFGASSATAVGLIVEGLEHAH